MGLKSLRFGQGFKKLTNGIEENSNENPILRENKMTDIFNAFLKKERKVNYECLHIKFLLQHKHSLTS